MKTLTTALLALVITSGCGKRPPPPLPETVAPPPEAVAPRPSEPLPFTLTYTYKAKADGTALTWILKTRTGASTRRPRCRARTTSARSTRAWSRTSRASSRTRSCARCPRRTTPGRRRWWRLELLDAKGNLWRRHFAGMPPKVTSPLFDRLERLQRAAQREDRPPAVMKLDVTRTPAGGGPVEVISINANSLVLVTADGKPKALGRVGGSALDTLRVTLSVLPQLQPRSRPGRARGSRWRSSWRKNDEASRRASTAACRSFAEPVMQVIAELEAGTKPVATFNEITYQVPRPGKGKKQVQTLTVLPSRAAHARGGRRDAGHGRGGNRGAVGPAGGAHQVEGNKDPARPSGAATRSCA